MKRLSILLITLLVTVIPTPGRGETLTTVGAGGLFPSDTSFNGVSISGLQSGYGIVISDDGSAAGQFCTVLLGVSGVSIKIEGTVSSGSRMTANIVTFSGTSTIDMGDGTPSLPGVPFTATITTNSNDEGTIGLVLGSTTLPDATVSEGSMTIK